ncbi:hypothetical protein Tco_0972682 [Tanacetum coccineum]
MGSSKEQKEYGWWLVHGQRRSQYFSFGRHLDELHVTWAYLKKKRTRLRTNTKTLEDLCSQSLETASMIEDLGSIIDSGLSEVVLGQPFARTSKLTHDESLGLIRFAQRDDEVVFRMPQRTKELDRISPFEKDKFEAFFVDSLKNVDLSDVASCDGCARLVLENQLSVYNFDVDMSWENVDKLKYKKAVKNKQARIRESEEYKKKPKNQSRSQKSQALVKSKQRKAQVKWDLLMITPQLTQLSHQWNDTVGDPQIHTA